MTRQHIEFDLDYDGTWEVVSPGMPLLRTIDLQGFNSYEVYVPDTALFTTAFGVSDTIPTQGDLAALPHLAVVIDRSGDAWQKRGEHWFMCGDDCGESITGYAPYKVAYLP
jgi:hypothetical protein